MYACVQNVVCTRAYNNNSFICTHLALSLRVCERGVCMSVGTCMCMCACVRAHVFVFDTVCTVHMYVCTLDVSVALDNVLATNCL